MSFYEALFLLEEGMPIRRKAWLDIFYIKLIHRQDITKSYFAAVDFAGEVSFDYQLSAEDIIANDWEVI